MADVTPTGEDELRAKYNTADRKQMAKDGSAMPDGSYPIKDAEDLSNAIHAVGRGGADHDAIRKHIIARAKALGLSKQIPDNWNADGSMKQANTLTASTERRRKPRHRAVPLMPEVRHFAATGLEVRSQSDTDEIIITGSPIVYGVPYTVRDMFGEFEERMAPGVAGDVLSRGADVRFLFNHDGLPLARSTAGTMTFNDTARSLDFEAHLDARQQLANDLAIAIQRGDVSQMSCGFIVARDEWDDSMEHRTVHQFADMPDISAVTYPASPTTSLQVAQRMALEVPVESRARLRSIYAELRGGKVLSQSNQDKLVQAAHAIHAILDSAGFDPGDLVGQEGADTEPDTEPQVEVHDDGTVDGASMTGQSDEMLVAARSAAAGRTLRTLRMQAEARRHRRPVG